MGISQAIPGHQVRSSSIPKLPENRKNWLWLTPGRFFKKDIRGNLARLKESGFDAVLVQAFNGRKTRYASGLIPADDYLLEEMIPAAKSAGLEIHAWIFSLLCNVDTIREKHPDWFSINRNLRSSLEEPPYVSYYRWLCPAKPAVREYLSVIVSEISRIAELDGIHLDYIRYPDVILPEALQSKYHLVQDTELAEFDFCYCQECRNDFMELSGIDPFALKDPVSNSAWREFREQNITQIVADLAGIVRGRKKIISAAVFPTPEIARKLVRQHWPHWDVDAFFPMIYHKYYKRELNWIKPAVREGVEALVNKTPLYAGIYLPFLTPADIPAIDEYVTQGGASGLALFEWDELGEEYWPVLGNYLSSRSGGK